jgi:hypothetical protein
MLFKLPRDTKEIHWTEHIKEKMKQYQLSERRILKVFRNPERKEEGVAPETIAVMQTAGRRHLYEIWLMYQIKKSKVKRQKAKFEGKRIIMISAWKYPGKSPIRKPPIPEEVLENLEEILKE